MLLDGFAKEETYIWVAHRYPSTFRWRVGTTAPRMHKMLVQSVPSRFLPVIPDARRIVHENMGIYYDCHAPSPCDARRTPSMNELDVTLGVTLKALFEECDALDMWELVWRGRVVVSGSILLYLLDQMPWTVEDLRESDIDLFPISLEEGVRINGQWIIDRHEWSVSPRPPIDLHGFVAHGRRSTEYPFEGVWNRQVTNPLMPQKLQFIIKQAPASIAEFDFAFLSNYYTRGRLYVLAPGAFVSRVGVLNHHFPTKQSRIDKYTHRGFIVPSSPEYDRFLDIRWNLSDPPIRRRRECDTRIPLDAEWDLDDDVLTVSPPTAPEKYIAKMNPLKRIQLPQVDPYDRLIVQIAVMWRESRMVHDRGGLYGI